VSSPTLADPPDVAADPQSALALPARRLQGTGSRARRVLRYAGMPLALAVTCVVLYWWVGTQTLDSIEQRVLNASVIESALLQHVRLVAVSTAIVVTAAVPTGILLTRSFARRLVPFVVGTANVGQSVPSLGVLVVLALVWTIGFKAAVVALVLYAFLPVLRNTMVGLQQVDPFITEAGRGQGMTSMSVLLRIEVPLAVPVILAGIRTALVINVGTATIAVLTNAGGLGEIIYAGIVQGRSTVLIAGSVLTAVFALGVDYLAGIAEELLSPRGL
jgi:osmoprotectant transport system permease protein